MKIAKWLLGSIGVVGGILVAQGVISGEELSSIQNVLGMALGGGGLTALSIITVLNNIPKSLVKLAFEKATEKYGEDKVLSFLTNIDTIIESVETLTNKVDTVIEKQEAQDQARQDLLG